MNAVKSTIKKLLIGNENKKYEKAVKSKYMDYTRWISEIESEYLSTNAANIENQKCQIIDIVDKKYDRENDNDDRKLAEYSELCKPNKENDFIGNLISALNKSSN